jgi:hypothetical protein
MPACQWSVEKGEHCTWVSLHVICWASCLFWKSWDYYAPTVAGLLALPPFPPHPEAEFLDEIQTKVLRVSSLLFTVTSFSFALRFLFLQNYATSYSFCSSVTVHERWHVQYFTIPTKYNCSIRTGKRKRSLIYLPKHYLCWRHSNVSNCKGASLHSIIWGMVFLIEEMRENFVIRRNHFLLRRPCRQTNRVDNLTFMSISCSFQNLSETAGAMFRAME